MNAEKEKRGKMGKCNPVQRSCGLKENSRVTAVHQAILLAQEQTLCILHTSTKGSDQGDDLHTVRNLATLSRRQSLTNQEK